MTSMGPPPLAQADAFGHEHGLAEWMAVPVGPSASREVDEDRAEPGWRVRLQASGKPGQVPWPVGYVRVRRCTEKASISESIVTVGAHPSRNVRVVV